MYRDLGIISIVIATTGLSLFLIKWPGKRSMTFSQHAAQSKLALLYYFVLFSTTLPMFYLFMTRWLIPAFNISHLVLWFLLPGLVLQEVAVLVPETKGIKVIVHRAAAFCMAILFMPVLTVIISTGTISSTARMVCLFTLGTQILIAALLIPLNGYHKNVLILQAVYFAGFMISILVVTYS